MKTLSLSALVAAFALAGLPSPRATGASTGIQRCTAPDGSVAYTDKACVAFGADNAPIPGDMMTRLLATMPEDEDEAESSARVTSRRPLASGCARTPMQLEADLLGSFALRDANRIAESFHWVGMSNAQGQRMMDRLQSLGKRPVRDAHYFNAQITGLPVAETAFADTSTWQAAASTGHDAGSGTLQLQLDGPAVTVIDLDVERYAGCYFVRF
jgi:hypothetical protein